MKETDGFENQNRCATYFYLLSNIVVKFNVIIDCNAGVSGQGKDIVDTLNESNKQYH